jgi:hypothetical protein
MNKKENNIEERYFFITYQCVVYKKVDEKDLDADSLDLPIDIIKNMSLLDLEEKAIANIAIMSHGMFNIPNMQEYIRRTSLNELIKSGANITNVDNVVILWWKELTRAEFMQAGFGAVHN